MLLLRSYDNPVVRHSRCSSYADSCRLPTTSNHNKIVRDTAYDGCSSYMLGGVIHSSMIGFKHTKSNLGYFLNSTDSSSQVIVIPVTSLPSVSASPSIVPLILSRSTVAVEHLTENKIHTLATYSPLLSSDDYLDISAVVKLSSAITKHNACDELGLRFKHSVSHLRYYTCHVDYRTYFHMSDASIGSSSSCTQNPSLITSIHASVVTCFYDIDSIVGQAMMSSTSARTMERIVLPLNETQYIIPVGDEDTPSLMCNRLSDINTYKLSAILRTNFKKLPISIECSVDAAATVNARLGGDTHRNCQREVMKDNVSTLLPTQLYYLDLPVLHLIQDKIDIEQRKKKQNNAYGSTYNRFPSEWLTLRTSTLRTLADKMDCLLNKKKAWSHIDSDLSYSFLPTNHDRYTNKSGNNRQLRVKQEMASDTLLPFVLKPMTHHRSYNISPNQAIQQALLRSYLMVDNNINSRKKKLALLLSSPQSLETKASMSGKTNIISIIRGHKAAIHAKIEKNNCKRHKVSESNDQTISSTLSLSQSMQVAALSKATPPQAAASQVVSAVTDPTSSRLTVNPITSSQEVSKHAVNEEKLYSFNCNTEPIDSQISSYISMQQSKRKSGSYMNSPPDRHTDAPTITENSSNIESRRALSTVSPCKPVRQLITATTTSSNKVAKHESSTAYTILASDTFFEYNYDLFGTLSQSMHINVIDVPLEQPITMIADYDTCICCISDGFFYSNDAKHMESFVRSLVNIHQKFSSIWILIARQDNAPTDSVTVRLARLDKELLFYQSLARFPCTIAVRPIHTSLLCTMIASICDTCRKRHVLDRQSEYLFQENLSKRLQAMRGKCFDNPIFIANCKLMQQFPTINFYVAALLLYVYSVRELTHMDDVVATIKQSSSSILSFIHTDKLNTMIELMKKHVGLQSTLKLNKDI